jgi:hypothetical protein
VEVSGDREFEEFAKRTGSLVLKVASIPGASITFKMSDDRKRLVSEFRFVKQEAGDSIVGHN